MRQKLTFFLHTLLFKMIAIFLITSLVPAYIVVRFIPQYYNNVMTENINLLTNTVVEASVTNIRTYMDDLERLLVVPYMDSSIMKSIYTLKEGFQGRTVDERDRLEAQRILNKTLPSYTQYARQDIIGTLLCFDEKNALALYRDRSSLVEEFDFSKENWYQSVWDANGRNVFISTHNQNYLRHQTNRQVFSVARLIKDLDTKLPIAIIKIDVDKNLLSTIMEDIQLNVYSIMTVVDQNGEMLYSNKPLDDVIMGELRENKAKINSGQVYDVISHKVEETGWEVKALVSETEYQQQIIKLQITVIIIYFVALAAAVLLYGYLSSRITRPLKSISLKMKEVENGNFNVRFHAKNKDEIARLGNSFNIMTERLNHLINQEYKAVIAAQKAEYYALQSQIEPHFLYNVLNSMVGINRMGDKRLLEETINSLAGMLRYMTRQSDTATVREEFDMLEQYCSLQKLRLQERFFYKIEASEEVQSHYIPKLLIQPLVENSIIHGIEPTGETGIVTVKACRTEDCMLYIVVEDTGCGFDLKKVTEEKESVGIANVISRLHLLDEKAEVNMVSEPGKGSRIILKIPINLEESVWNAGVANENNSDG